MFLGSSIHKNSSNFQAPEINQTYPPEPIQNPLISQTSNSALQACSCASRSAKVACRLLEVWHWTSRLVSALSCLYSRNVCFCQWVLISNLLKWPRICWRAKKHHEAGRNEVNTKVFGFKSIFWEQSDFRHWNATPKIHLEKKHGNISKKNQLHLHNQPPKAPTLHLHLTCRHLRSFSFSTLSSQLCLPKINQHKSAKSIRRSAISCEWHTCSSAWCWQRTMTFLCTAAILHVEWMISTYLAWWYIYIYNIYIIYIYINIL